MIYFIRHGETSYNREGRVQGHLDIELNEKGIREEKDIKNYLKSVSSGVAESQSKQSFEQRTYTAEELSAVYDSLDDVEL